MSRKLTVLALVSIVAAAAAAMISGCEAPRVIGKSFDSGKGKVTLSFWESYNNEEHKVFLELVEPFRQDFTRRTGREIELLVSRVPHDGLLPKLKLSTQTHTTPDICRVDCAHVVALAFGQALYALDGLSNFGTDIATFRQSFVEAAVDSNIIEVKGRDGKWSEHLFGLPDQTNCVCLYWNREIFRARANELRARGLDPGRPPATWDEFVEYGKALACSEKGIYPFGMSNSLWWTFPFFNSFGARFVERDTKTGKLICVLDSDEAVRALTFRNDLYRVEHEVGGQRIRIEAGAWQAGAKTPDQGFINGMYAMVISGPWNLETYRKAGVDFGVATIPAGPAGTSSNVGGTNLVIFKTCRYPEIALDLLRYITSADFQVKWCERLGQIPVSRAAYDSVNLGGREDLKTFYRQMLHTKARPRLPQYDLLEEIINPEMELSIKGAKSPKEALEDAVEEINRRVLSLVNE